MNFDKFEYKIENVQTKGNAMNSYHENLLTPNTENLGIEAAFTI